MKLTSDDQSLMYIRERYKVPAYRGVEVMEPNGRKGIIEGGDGAYIVAMFEGQPKTGIYHPMDLKYNVVGRSEKCMEPIEGGGGTKYFYVVTRKISDGALSYNSYPVESFCKVDILIHLSKLSEMVITLIELTEDEYNRYRSAGIGKHEED